MGGVSCIIYHDGERIVVDKSIESDPAIIHETIRSLSHDIVLHFRLATTGETDLDNTHPLEILQNELYLMHNGTLDMVSYRGGHRSDTRFLVEEYLTPAIPNLGTFTRERVITIIKSCVKRFVDPMVFLDGSGRLTILNPERGMKWGDLWLSNTYS